MGGGVGQSEWVGGGVERVEWVGGFEKEGRKCGVWEGAVRVEHGLTHATPCGVAPAHAPVPPHAGTTTSTTFTVQNEARRSSRAVPRTALS